MGFDFSTISENGAAQLLGGSSYFTVYQSGIYNALSGWSARIPVGDASLVNGEYIPIVRKADGTGAVSNVFYVGGFYVDTANGNAATITVGSLGAWEVVILRVANTNDVSLTDRHGMVLYGPDGTVKYTSSAPSFVVTTSAFIYVGAYDANRTGSFVVTTSPYPDQKLYVVCREALLTIGTNATLNIPIQNVAGGTVIRQYKMSFSVSGTTVTYTLTFNQQFTQQTTVPVTTGVTLRFFFGLIR